MRTRDWLRAARLPQSTTTFTRMRIDLDPATGRAGGPPATDVVVRRVTDEADLRVAHDIDEESFLEHYGNVPISFETWLERLTERGDGLPQVYLADVDGAAGRAAHQQPRSSSRTRTPATSAPSASCRPAAAAGSARRCCATASPARAARRRSAVLLHVDVANVTGALRLYESVGMRAVLEIDAWGKGERLG